MKRNLGIALIAGLMLLGTLQIVMTQPSDAQCRRLTGNGYVVTPTYGTGYGYSNTPVYTNRPTTITTPSGYGGFPTTGMTSQTTVVAPMSRANVFNGNTYTVQPAQPVYYGYPAPVYYGYPGGYGNSSTTIINSDGTGGYSQTTTGNGYYQTNQGW